MTQPRNRRTDLPTGTVTFLFTDIEGSTRLLQAVGPAYADLLAAHRRLIVDAAEAHGGHTFGSEGDALFIAFSDAGSAVVAAVSAQRALASHAWPDGRDVLIRMGINTGDATLSEGDYVGLPLHKAARITAAGHGGQILLSGTSRALVSDLSLDGIALRDLGEHRLKDLSHPERIFEVEIAGLERTFPPLRMLDLPANNLPVQLTSFIGRDELKAARRLLDGTRLLTLTGPGGTGKTRLALQLAAEVVDDFPDGVTFVPLDAVFDPLLIPSAIAEALHMEPGTTAPLTRLVEYLKDRIALIVLDNFEQVVAGAAVVGQLLTIAPRLKIVVTSRIVLRIHGEQDYPVPPLGLPRLSAVSAAREIAGIESVRLFVERAMASQPSFTLTDANAGSVADIVMRLDGLPLAIELAAARIRILPIESLQDRLGDRLGTLTGGARDRPERQQTLRGAIDWSHDLLDGPDREIFARFSVFAGGACLQEAEQICGPAVDLGRDVLAGLESLVDASLVRAVPDSQTGPRFVMLATIREYASERLEDSARVEQFRRRHAVAYVALLEAAADHLTGPSSRRWLDRLELDHDNIRASFDWAVRTGEAEVALRIVASAWRFWQVRGHLHEAQVRCAQALAIPTAEKVGPATKARALGAAGSIAYWRGDWPEAHGHYQAAVTEARRSGDLQGIADALYNLAFVPAAAPPGADGFVLGAEHIREALAIYHRLGDERGVANTNWALGLGTIAAGDWDASRAYIGESLGAYRALNDRFGIGWALFELALIEVDGGTSDVAETYALDALDVFAATDDMSAQVLGLFGLQLIAEQRGQLERSWRLAGAASALRERTGADLVLVSGAWGDRRVPERPIDDPVAEQAWIEGEAMSSADAITYALSVRT